MNVPLLLLLVFFMLDRDIKYRKENERKQNYVFYISLAIFFCSFLRFVTFINKEHDTRAYT